MGLEIFLFSSLNLPGSRALTSLPSCKRTEYQEPVDLIMTPST
jgi:hypothetical protein